VDLESFPTLVRVDAALCALEAFTATHPSCQPDTPGELRN
jgi:maleylacetoacetate isomerase